ncbi:PA2485 family small membrane protein [Pseudomonas sp. C11]|nr:PA2485 family small membrane protein [Pseudomonas sp. C11]
MSLYAALASFAAASAFNSTQQSRPASPDSHDARAR